MATIDELIDKRVGQVRSDTLDLSFGEIINLHEAKELTIQPEYQRLFRWSDVQQSRIIESILLELPIPQIFLIETTEGVLELVDGLQRISSVIRFIQPELIDKEPLKLTGCDIIKELDGYAFDDLPLRLRLRLKRSTVRAILIKRQSSSKLRYEMFKRLNTGGSLLSGQEIRNCTARMIGNRGIEFYKFLMKCASYPAFVECTQTLPESDKDQKADEELVLRFFALKNARDLFQGSVRDWLDTYMEKVNLGELSFPYKTEKRQFERVFDQLSALMGAGSFVRYRGMDPIGGLAPAYYEAISMAAFELQDKLSTLPQSIAREAIIKTVQSTEFRSVTGPASNTKNKLESRIRLVAEALRSVR